MKQREETDFSYVCEQTIHLLSLEDFLVEADPRGEEFPLESRLSVQKKDVTITAFVVLSGGNVFVKSVVGRVIGKFKFSVSVPSQVAGMLFSEWIQELNEFI